MAYSAIINTRLNLSQIIDYHWADEYQLIISIKEGWWQILTQDSSQTVIDIIIMWHHPHAPILSNLARIAIRSEHLSIGMYFSTIRNVLFWWQPFGDPTECYVVMLMPMFWEVSFVVSLCNKLFSLFHSFGCEQTVSNMLTTFSAFATHGDAHGVNPISSTRALLIL